ncbi:cobalamin adenosyltransferase [Lysobacteraceae bacterium NML07-0707]|nr:cobalamin adenosyltransferase [Xanthomonadaceae bacterium NML07-0707]
MDKFAPIGKVILLHGIWMPEATLRPLARRLAAAGFMPEIFPYSSIFSPTDATVKRLLARLKGQPAHLLGHSLGGLIALAALSAAAPSQAAGIGRVLCLGTPLKGSRVAKSLARRRLSGHLLGGNARLLQDGCCDCPQGAEVGMIAGNLGLGIGRLLARFDEVNDGTVALSETQLPWLACHCLLAAGHNGLLWSDKAAQQAVHFFRHGSFMSAD